MDIMSKGEFFGVVKIFLTLLLVMFVGGLLICVHINIKEERMDKHDKLKRIEKLENEKENLLYYKIFNKEYSNYDEKQDMFKKMIDINEELKKLKSEINE